MKSHVRILVCLLATSALAAQARDEPVTPTPAPTPTVKRAPVVNTATRTVSDAATPAPSPANATRTVPVTPADQKTAKASAPVTPAGQKTAKASTPVAPDAKKTAKAATAPTAAAAARTAPASPKAATGSATATDSPAVAADPAVDANKASTNAGSKALAIDLATLESRLVNTDAIGFFTKLELKSQLDDLTQKFRNFHKANSTVKLPALREEFDLLLLKLLTLLQDEDPTLHQEVAAARPRIWQTFSDPALFAKL